MKQPIQRKNIRLKNYDYSQKGYYFITICTKDRIKILSQIINEQCKLSDIGKIAEKYIITIEEKYNVRISEYIIMPNHIHMIIIKDDEEVSISRIIQQYKGTVSKKAKCKIWQKSFYEHIIRNEKEHYKIIEYIINNPIKWDEDEYNK